MFYTIEKMKEEIKSLTPKEHKILLTIEELMKRFFFVPKELISKYMKIDINRLDYMLVDLSGRKLIKVFKKRNFVGFQLTYFGYDLLAFKYLLDNEFITDIDTVIEKGKESDIILVFKDQEPYALKVYHIGRTSFRNIYRKRLFFFERKWSSWLHACYLAAKREYEVTKEIMDKGVPTTRPMVWNRSTILFEYLENVKELGRVVLKDPETIFYNVLKDYAKVVNELGIVHGDFNVFNVLITEDQEKYYIIDWGQYLETKDPGSKDILRKEIEEFVDFFQRKYRLKIDESEIYSMFNVLR